MKSWINSVCPLELPQWAATTLASVRLNARYGGITARSALGGFPPIVSVRGRDLEPKRTPLHQSARKRRLETVTAW